MSVSIECAGGLGNQLFQIATAYAYSRRYKSTLYISNKKHDPRPFYWDSILEKCKQFVTKTMPESSSWHEASACIYTEIPYRLNISLHMYFQSSKYFNDYKDEIKELFSGTYTLPEHLQKWIEQKERVVIIHARRTDYLRNQDIINFHGPLTPDYYMNAVDRIKTIVDNPIFILISDDPSYWNQCNIENSVILEEDDITTFRFIQHFYYFIIANSTFSWWGAWLSSYRKVIAPKKWFGPTGPNHQDIYEADWELI